MRRLVAAGLCVMVAGPVAAKTGQDVGPDIERALQALAAAPDEQEARRLEVQLHELWRHAATPACTMLLERAMREVQAGSGDAAVEDAGAVLVLQPELAEAFWVRAVGHLTEGDMAGAIRDAAEALRREPRHIGALQTLSHAAEQSGQMVAAYEAWRKVIALDPKVPDGQARLNEMRRRAMGDDI